MTHEIWFHLVMDFTTVLSYIIFTILIIITELEHYRIIIIVTFLYWSYLVMKKKYVKKIKFQKKKYVIRQKNSMAVVIKSDDG